MQETIVFLVRVQCRRKESSRSLSHLLMSFLYSRYYRKHFGLFFRTQCICYYNEVEIHLCNKKHYFKITKLYSFYYNYIMLIVVVLLISSSSSSLLLFTLLLLIK